MEILSPNDTTSPRRINDDRVWYSRNLRCASCEGFCPICESPCCIYKASKEVLAKPKSLQTEMSAHLLQVIEGLGAKVKDMDTFSMCTLGGGCGRRVCPSCCGVCPTELCRDIQCKVFTHSDSVNRYNPANQLLGVQARPMGRVRLAFMISAHGQVDLLSRPCSLRDWVSSSSGFVK